MLPHQEVKNSAKATAAKAKEDLKFGNRRVKKRFQSACQSG
jgi:hypothetical protein